MAWYQTDGGRRVLLLLLALAILVPVALVRSPHPVATKATTTVATIHQGNLSAARMLPVTQQVLRAAEEAQAAAATRARQSHAATQASQAASRRTATPSGALPITHYTVQPGDTLSGIAARFGTDLASLEASNRLGANSVIQPGQHLVVPTQVGWVYQVAAGDTLGRIAAVSGLSTAALAQANHIGENSILRIGQRLWIPHDPPASATLGPVARSGSRSSAATGSGHTSALMPWPVHGPITSPFGWRILFGKRNFHYGIDIGVPMYTHVHASMSGRVITAGWFGPYGIAVRIVRGDLMTLYAHNSRVLVKVGQYVRVGQLISYSGMTGNATGPHVHFGVYINGRAVNPMNYLQR